MKFLTAIILSLSLLVSSSFAVSLTPPLVLKMQEDRSMAASDFTTEETPENNSNPLKFVVGIYSIGFCFFGLLWAGFGFEMLYDEDYHGKTGAMIGGGLGMAALGGLGIWWAF
ncbi:hypothetical protein [Fibrobacter sp. UBA4297]|uniref:hypothetical protein n=1 Tax=Fibrobacter sp. UBA4297 TaxID=1946536 RepID=UPI0025BE32CA|nr:hypothetical protein [Fibrobacter sp. UBA4297]